MSKKKIVPFEDVKETMTILNTFMSGSGSNSIIGSLFGSNIMKDPRDNDVFDLGYGISIVKDETIKDNKNRYSHLYKDGKKLSNTLFRLGGMGYGFNGKLFTQLIIYPNYPKETWGNHCIINSDGNVVLTQEKLFDNLYYLDGVIATMNKVYYNLLTGEAIVEGNNSVKSKKYLFIENRYNDKYCKGVYKINYETGEFEIFN